MLTATPVQVHSDNLFTLLHLLRPDLFPDRTVFREVLEPNRYLTHVVRILRQGPAGGEQSLALADEELRKAARTEWGRNALSGDPRYVGATALLERSAIADDDRVRCIRDLEELHSLAHVMNRTRRRDIGRFTVREPRTVSVPFTSEQEQLYEEILAFRREVLLQAYDPQIVRLILDTFERQAASSITALAAGIEQVLAAGGFGLADLTDDPEAEEQRLGIPSDLLERAKTVLALARRLPEHDPKLERLLSVVHETTAETDGPGKVLVFSYFLHTIGYLRERLERAGIRVGVVTGLVEDEEREILRDRFRLDRTDPSAIDVLLSSEVGCEGLDYEFCDRLVNYDIPWNPMRVEQRIGRIDRFGQRSEKVLIFNFITPGTVEERVFFRCFDRLGVFTDTVGDLEEVLGELVDDLTHLALDASLTPAQAEARARQVADNAIRLSEEQRRLDAESGSLFGLDDEFTEEINQIAEGGRFVSPADVETLVAVFLAQLSLKGRLVLESGNIYKLQLPDSGRRELTTVARALGSPDRVRRQRFFDPWSRVRILHSPLTRKRLLRIARLDFVTPVHPLARLARIDLLRNAEPLVAGFRAQSSNVAPGRYIFTCEMWETIAVRPDVRLVCLAVGLEDGQSADDVSAEVVNFLTVAELLDGSPNSAIADVMTQRFHQLDAISDTRRRAAMEQLATSNDELLNRRLASLEGFYENRVQRVMAELGAATEPCIVRMKTSELARIESDQTERRAALDRARDVEILSQRVAAGVVEIHDAS